MVSYGVASAGTLTSCRMATHAQTARSRAAERPGVQASAGRAPEGIGRTLPPGGGAGPALVGPALQPRPPVQERGQVAGVAAVLPPCRHARRQEPGGLVEPGDR